MLAIFTHVCQHCHIWNAKKPYNWDFSLKPLAFLRVSPYAPKRKFVGSNPARDAKKAYKLYVYGLFYGCYILKTVVGSIGTDLTTDM